MEEATKLCDHVALLNEGTIVEYGVPKEVCLRYNKNKSYQIQLTSGHERIVPHSASSAEQIARWMMQDELVSIHSCEPTLETVFLEVTGRELV